MKSHFEITNRLFKNFTSYIAIESGMDPMVARNIVRWHMNQVKPKAISKKTWTDPKTGLALSVEQWKGPLNRLTDKVLNGTKTGPALENKTDDQKWDDLYFDGGSIGRNRVILSGKDTMLIAKQFDDERGAW